MTNQMNPTINRRTAMRGLGIAGLAAAGGALIPATAANAATDLVVVDQMGTGTWEQENCGPTAAVIALVAVGNAPADYVSGSAGSAPGGNAPVVKDMRAFCGLSPWGQPSAKSVTYWGADLADIELGITEYGSSISRSGYADGVDAAADGSVVILHVHHGTLIGESANYGHYVVAQGTDSSGNIQVSDPGRAQSLGITGYTRSQLLNAQKGAATLVS